MDFMRFRWLYFLISALVILPGVYSLARWGLKPSVDFTGGTLLELKFEEKVTKDGVVQFFKDQNIGVYLVQPTEDGAFLIRTAPLTETASEDVLKAMYEKLGKAEVVREETVGPTLGQELLIKTVAAVILAASFIVIYVGYRFKSLKFGLCAILAMFHDTLILIGTFSWLGHFFRVEIDTLFVTAVLTILSFSVHDTVVVYDRIRETRKKAPGLSFVEVVNRAVTETLVRSVNNSLTIIFMLLALVLMGGETIRWFVVALLVGTAAGTYSSTFTAAPLLVVWENIQSRFKKS